MIKVIRNIDIAYIRLAEIEFGAELSYELSHLLEELSEAKATLESSPSFEIVKKAVSSANKALSFVVAHIEPYKPWPRK